MRKAQVLRRQLAKTKKQMTSGTKYSPKTSTKGNTSRAKTLGVLYSRTSSAGQKVDRSKKRQHSRGLMAAKILHVPVVKQMAEIISGSKPIGQRHMLRSLIEGKVDPKAIKALTPSLNASKVNIFVESARAVARDSFVGEQLYQLSKKTGNQIVPADMPDLFSLEPKPETSMMRKIIMALVEYDRDNIIYRTTAGLKAKMETSTKVTQHGSVKVNGTKSILDSLPDGSQKKTFLKKVKMPIQRYLDKNIGLRSLAQEITKLLPKTALQAAKQKKRSTKDEGLGRLVMRRQEGWPWRYMPRDCEVMDAVNACQVNVSRFEL